MAPSSRPQIPAVLRIACLLLVTGVQVRAHGKMFVLRPMNRSAQWDPAAAQGLCREQGARLATADELRRAVEECAFTECTTGWIAGNQIGITMCNNMGFSQQGLQTIRVKTEAASSPGPYDSFCIKDQGKPCGDPPSFPNTILQGHTGIEMGDELLYVCAQGYIMANREKAFSLLCDSCGEWYGFVQACIKDKTEGHVDYEDKFPDEDSMSFSNLNEQGRFIVSEDGETGLGDELGEGTDGSIGEDGQETLKSTESPVSLLSQKHLFWFPSEVFPSTEQPDTKEPDMKSKLQITSSDNQIGVKTDVTKRVQTAKGKDLPDEPSIVHNETKVIKETIASTDETWVDGYPIVSENTEEGEKVDGSIEVESETTITTDHSNYIEISRADTPSTTSATHYTQINVPTRMPGQGGKQVDIGLTPTTEPENVSVSKAIEDANFYTTTFLITDADESRKSPDVMTASSPSPENTGVSEGLYPVDHAPIPTETEEISTHNTLTLGTPEASTRTWMDFTEIDAIDAFAKGENFSDGTEAKLLPTVDSCTGPKCLHSNKGPIIAVIVAVIGLLVLAVILAIWCYKRRHQKTSIYQLNGKGQVRRTEHIEMQRKL
ncbi:sushi domain-containing protein 5 [Chiloscyllium plagiosum]|uniref:sushi domain-containing protein 5 n=1 Tax=Chiloscyllium plagiosum TaxID=36176 RepID=UPI001CB7E047|nr:sushi domain-containing protein 5 [Chiloscyllium plagiosum]